MTTFDIRSSSRAALAAALLLTAGCAWAGETLHYYDGEQRRSIQLQPDLVAEIATAPGAPAARSRAAAAEGTAVGGDSLVRLYRLPATAARAAQDGSTPALAMSPVYREGNSPGGRLMALPGGVLVKFKPDWTRERVDTWLDQRSLVVERKLGFGVNWYRVATAPGAASLETANAIYQSGDVLAATPNWWVEVVKR